MNYTNYQNYQNNPNNMNNPNVKEEWKDWEIKIYDCHKNFVMFLCASCVPCGCILMQASNAKLSDKNKNSRINAYYLASCLLCIGGIINRYRLRQKLKIKSPVTNDILFSCFLPCFSVTQEFIQTVKSIKGDEMLLLWETSNVQDIANRNRN